MNDEIKEILECLKIALNSESYEVLLDYITNLQQDNEKIGKLWREEEAHCILLQQENEELKKKLDRRYYKNEYEKIKEENERLKEDIEDISSSHFSLFKRYEDYESRCEKAILMLKELNQCIKDILNIGIDIKNISDIEDLLQNGSDSK